MNTKWFELVERYKFNLYFGYRNRKWELQILEINHKEEGTYTNTVFAEWDEDKDLLLSRGEVALKEWLIKYKGGY